MKLELFAIENFPEVDFQSSLSDLILNSARENKWEWDNGDIVVIAQKVISKAENRLVDLTSVIPGERAFRYAKATNKDPRLVELILSESKKVLRTRGGLIIVQHKLGFICANAGIDHSNVRGLDGSSENWVLLLPEDPDMSAKKIRKSIETTSGKRIGVIIIDSHGRPWRNGIVGVSIGISGVPGVIDKRGALDRFGYQLRVTEIGAADEIAAAASILMGQANEGRPIVVVRGFPYDLREGSLDELIRDEKDDLFR